MCKHYILPIRGIVTHKLVKYIDFLCLGHKQCIAMYRVYALVGHSASHFGSHESLVYVIPKMQV